MSSTEIATIEPEKPAVGLVLRPVLKPAAMIEAHKEAALIIAQVLEKDKDYGVIPGTGKKPSLLKPGAERLAVAFGCRWHYELMESEADHFREVPWTKRKKVWENGRPTFTEETGTATGLYRYVVRAILTREGEVMGEGVGSCSSLEAKYADRPRESENTILKMAKKRAQVDAVLTTFSLSDRFTQDVEDLAHEEPAPPPPPTKPKDVDLTTFTGAELVKRRAAAEKQGKTHWVDKINDELARRADIKATTPTPEPAGFDEVPVPLQVVTPGDAEVDTLFDKAKA